MGGALPGWLGPEQFPWAGVQTREHAADAGGVDLAAGHGRRGPRPLAEVAFPRPPLVWGGIGLGPPEFLAGGDLEAQHQLVVLLPGEDIDLTADHHGRGDAFADGHFPFFLEHPGPLRRACHAVHDPIPVRPAPLRPIRSGRRSRSQQVSCSDVQEEAGPLEMVSHSIPHLSPMSSGRMRKDRSVVPSLIRMRSPRNTGCACVSVSDTW